MAKKVVKKNPVVQLPSDAVEQCWLDSVIGTVTYQVERLERLETELDAMQERLVGAVPPRPRLGDEADELGYKGRLDELLSRANDALNAIGIRIEALNELV